jgi:hypothetical protein
MGQFNKETSVMGETQVYRYTSIQGEEIRRRRKNNLGGLAYGVRRTEREAKENKKSIRLVRHAHHKQAQGGGKLGEKYMVPLITSGELMEQKL